MLLKKKIIICFVSLISIFSICFNSAASTVSALDSFAFIILSNYKVELNIGESFYIVAIPLNGDRVSWSSSDTKIASVNTYGNVIAKKAGNVTIIAKIKNAEASCKVNVKQTTITLSRESISMENGLSEKITGITSNGSAIKWKSSRSSIVSVSEEGIITSKKPGEATIIASADGTSVNCNVIVKNPTISISNTSIKLYRNGIKQLSAKISSNKAPVWKSNRKSVATVDSSGKVTAIKHGTALITVTVDGVSKTCEVLVEQPEVTLGHSEITIKKGEQFTLQVKVSSGNTPVWSSSNTSIATVNSSGVITAHRSGKAYIYANEDGIKSRCTVKVTE